MKVFTRIPVFIMAVAIVAVVSLSAGFVQAVVTNIAVLDMQKALAGSDAGKKAQQVMEKKMAELQEKFKAEETELIALQEEIKKKSSVWSEEKKKDQVGELQKKSRDFRIKQDDAKLEIQSLQEKQLGPILQEMEKVVDKVAKDKGYTIILPRAAVVFADTTVDITDEVTKALNEMTK